MNNNSVDLNEFDLQTLLPQGYQLPPAPYTPDQDYKEQIRTTQIALKRAIDLQQRLKALVHAFYLGQLFDDVESTAKKFKRKRLVSRHYGRMAENIFDVFESDPTQMLDTIIINVQEAQKWKRGKILYYRSIVEAHARLSFAGAQN